MALGGGVAFADAQAEAVALFDQGIKDMKAGNFEKACKSLAQSLSLVNDSGTKGALARCYEKQGKLATSWLLWRELADTAPTPDLRKDATKQANKLDARVPKYQVAHVGMTPGLVLMVNDKTVDPLIDIPVPIDPGPVHVSATAPGHEPWKAELKAEEGKVLSIEVPELVASKVVPDKTKNDKGKKVASPGRGRRLLGYTLVGIGVGAAGAGGFFGLQARSRYADAKDICGGTIDQCDPLKVDDAQSKVDSARSAGTLSTALFAAGGAAVAIGIVVVVTAPKAKEQRTVTVAPAPGGVTVFGRF
jgi:hypothetical protein